MKPYKVSEVNKYINNLLSTDFILSDIKVEGEISNFIHHYSGHMYFELKDEESIIKCVMFKSDNKALNFDIKNGDNIIANGNISVYERNGVYQLYVRSIEKSGVGELYKEFIKLKNKLNKEGFFDEKNKKKIPKTPKKIGIVTSITGAAIKDIISVIKRRFPMTDIIIYPALVQGDNSSLEIIKGLKYLDSREDVELIIFGRGGGSMEELFSFNDENLAKTIFHLETPNISAIGHEIDYTIADFVSDLRAPTPSAAAELAVPDINNYYEDLDNKIKFINNEIFSKLESKIKHNERLYSKLQYLNPKSKIQNKKQDLDNIFNKLLINHKINMNEKNSELIELYGRLKVLDPSLGLNKGMGILSDKKGNIIKSIDSICTNDVIKIRMKDGSILTEVKEVRSDE